MPWFRIVLRRESVELSTTEVLADNLDAAVASATNNPNWLVVAPHENAELVSSEEIPVYQYIGDTDA